MIRIVENDSITAMQEYCAGDPFGCRILATYRAYGLGESFAQFWLQYDENENITATIGSLDNGITICARGSYDAEEIDAFVHMLAGETGALRPVREGEIADGLVMKLDRTFFSESGGEAEINPPCEDVYTVIENCPGLGFDVPPFSALYPDMYRRIKSGVMMTAILRNGIMPVSCAAVHIAGGVGLVHTCATVPASRGKGMASSCIRTIISRQSPESDMYVMCLPNLCGYYESIGFRITGGFCNR